MAVVDLGDVHAVIYLDDIVVHGSSIEEVWKETVVVLERLCRAGFMINIKKSKFLVQEAKILGHELRPGYIKPNYKKLQTLIKKKRPTNAKELQSLFGLLSYFR